MNIMKKFQKDRLYINVLIFLSFILVSSANCGVGWYYEPENKCYQCNAGTF